MKISWIHFSDLHLGNDMAVETLLMRRRLPRYIASLNQSFDYAFCTGDIKEWSSGYAGASEYLNKLLTASKTDIRYLFVVPGNHDVDVRNEDRKALIKSLPTTYQSTVGTLSDSDLSVLQSGKRDFQSFVAEMLGKDRAEKYNHPHFVITTEHLNVLHVDSTLTYMPGHERDHIIGTRALMDALEDCEPEKHTVLLTHYSFDYLTQDERNEVESLLREYNVRLWLAGHEHENLIRWQREKFLECQCGNLALQNGARSCFLVGELDLDTGEGIITVHAWYEKEGWSQYPFARKGTSDDSIYPFVLRLPGDERPEDVSIELKNARRACDQLMSAGNLFANLRLNESIIADLTWNNGFYQNDDSGFPLEKVMAALWSDGIDHALILGDGGTGKSTMMFHACRRLLDSGRLAVYISLQAREGAGSEGLLDYILRSLYVSIDGRAKNKFVALVSERESKPGLVLFIDGFNELTGAGAQHYVAEIKALAQYKGIQIIVSSRLDFLLRYGMSHFGMIYTCPLREQQVRNLFSEEEWQRIVAYRELSILLRNPMMALLYADTCPVVERYQEQPYLNWKVPIHANCQGSCQ